MCVCVCVCVKRNVVVINRVYVHCTSLKETKLTEVMMCNVLHKHPFQRMSNHNTHFTLTPETVLVTSESCRMGGDSFSVSGNLHTIHHIIT